jgi:hypothetical protein
MWIIVKPLRIFEKCSVILPVICGTEWSWGICVVPWFVRSLTPVFEAGRHMGRVTEGKWTGWSRSSVYQSTAVLCLSVSRSNYCRSWWKGKQTKGMVQLAGPCSYITTQILYTAETTLLVHSSYIYSSTPWQKQEIFTLTSVSRPALGPTQPPVQWIPGVLSPGVKRGRGLTLTTHPI